MFAIMLVWLAALMLICVGVGVATLLEFGGESAARTSKRRSYYWCAINLAAAIGFTIYSLATRPNLPPQTITVYDWGVVKAFKRLEGSKYPKVIWDTEQGEVRLTSRVSEYVGVGDSLQYQLHIEGSRANYSYVVIHSDGSSTLISDCMAEWNMPAWHGVLQILEHSRGIPSAESEKRN